VKEDEVLSNGNFWLRHWMYNRPIGYAGNRSLEWVISLGYSISSLIVKHGD